MGNNKNNKLLIFASKEEAEGYSLKNIIPIAKKDSYKTIAEWAMENKLNEPCYEKTQK